MRMTNYHTHTARCKHAVNTDEEYVQAAIRAGYRVFGFADHCPWPYQGGFVSGIRMDVDQLDEYLESIGRLKEKYAGQITLYAGLECEYFPLYYDWLRDILRTKPIDYVILGNHSDLTDDGGLYFGEASTPEHIRLYTERTVAGMRTGLFSCLAHPDLVMRGYPVFDAACADMAYTLCRVAGEMGLPLEYNLMGNEYKRRTDLPWKGIGYPDDHFWKIAAEMGCTAVIGLDSHRAGHVLETKEYTDAAAYLDDLGIKRTEEIALFHSLQENTENR